MTSFTNVCILIYLGQVYPHFQTILTKHIKQKNAQNERKCVGIGNEYFLIGSRL